MLLAVEQCKTRLNNYHINSRPQLQQYTWLHVAINNREHIQVLIIFQESLAEVDIHRVPWVDVFEVVPLLEYLLRVPSSPGSACLSRTKTTTKTTTITTTIVALLCQCTCVQVTHAHSCAIMEYPLVGRSGLPAAMMLGSRGFLAVNCDICMHARESHNIHNDMSC